MIEIDADGDDRYDNNDPSDHEIEDFSDPNLNEIPDNIDDKGTNDNKKS